MCESGPRVPPPPSRKALPKVVGHRSGCWNRSRPVSGRSPHVDPMQRRRPVQLELADLRVQLLGDPVEVQRSLSVIGQRNGNGSQRRTLAVDPSHGRIGARDSAITQVRFRVRSATRFLERRPGAERATGWEMTPSRARITKAGYVRRYTRTVPDWGLRCGGRPARAWLGSSLRPR